MYRIHYKTYSSKKIIQPIYWLDVSLRVSIFFSLTTFRSRWIIESLSKPLSDASRRLYEGRVRDFQRQQQPPVVPSTSRNHGEGASKSRNARDSWKRCTTRRCRAVERARCVHLLVHEGPRYSAQVCAHKRRNFRYLWPGERLNLAAATFRRCIYLLFPQRG